MLFLLRPKLIIFSLLILLAFFWIGRKFINWKVESVVEKNIGIPVSINDIQYSKILYGRVQVGHFNLINPGYNGWIFKKIDIAMDNISIKPDLFSLLKSNKIIKSVSIDRINVDSFNDRNGSNNIVNSFRIMSSRINSEETNSKGSFVIKELKIGELVVNRKLSNGEYANFTIKNLKMENLGGDKTNFYSVMYAAIGKSTIEGLENASSPIDVVNALDNTMSWTQGILNITSGILDSINNIAANF